MADTELETKANYANSSIARNDSVSDFVQWLNSRSDVELHQGYGLRDGGDLSPRAGQSKRPVMAQSIDIETRRRIHQKPAPSCSAPAAPRPYEDEECKRINK